jgi:hypothetical protein
MIWWAVQSEAILREYRGENEDREERRVGSKFYRFALQAIQLQPKPALHLRRRVFLCSRITDPVSGPPSYGPMVPLP